ncbi:MAG TPA: hypothetical protein VJA21_13210 [Verrucomicrobiae bacterium]
MKTSDLALVLGLALCASGCTTYRYRILQPASGAPPVAAQSVTLHYEPLDYRLYRDRDHLAMQVSNPTDDRIVLLANRSFVTDPGGESHPVRQRVIGPHSFTRFLLPPIPFSYAYPDYWAYGPGWGWGYAGFWPDPMWGAWCGPGWWGPPPVAYAEVITPYDWVWKTGRARLKLTYERAGKVFEHDLEFVREPDRKEK